MDKINFKNIRVLPSLLDIKGNITNLGQEILSELQTSVVLKASVLNTTLSGKAILNTPYGKLSSDNKLNLVKGDSINIKIENNNGTIIGHILTINNKKLNIENSIKLNLITQHKIPQSLTNRSSNENLVNITNNSDIPEKIQGVISYLNLNKISKSSPIFKIITESRVDTNDKIPISLKIVPDGQAKFSAITFQGIVNDTKSDGSQLIKTDFGIVTTQNTKIPLGQKLMLEVVSLNNNNINYNINKNIVDLIFMINKNWNTIKNNLTLDNNSQKPTNLQNPIENNIQTAKEVNIGNNMLMEKANPDILNITQLPENIAQYKSLVQKLRKKELNSNQQVNKKHLSTKFKSENATPEQSNANKQSDTRNVNNLIKHFSENDKVRKILAEYYNIKEILNTSINEQNNPDDRWQTILIPFYNGQEVKEYEVQIDRSEEQFLRFIINVGFTDNPIQLDGFIRFEKGTKKPRTFDMIIRSEKPLDQNLQKNISNIYSLNQNITGIRGSFSTENSMAKTL